MEIPASLKSLYRHWKHHVRGDARAQEILLDNFSETKLFNEIQQFTLERISIWKKKTTGEASPYTNDAILGAYRFCNIFREFDRQTIEFHEMLAPLRDDFPLWLLNMFYCRMVARPETVRSVGLLSFDSTKNAEFYKKFMESSRPRFGTPYVFPVSTIQRSATPTRELFTSQHLPTIMKQIAEEIQTWNKKSVVNGVAAILPVFKFNHHFLWTEVLIDVAYQYPERVDLFAAFPIGPGSRPTMERIAKEAGSEINADILPELLAKIPLDTGLTFEGMPLCLSAENWEGIGCEFRKYTNLKAGKGRKRLYN